MLRTVLKLMLVGVLLGGLTLGPGIQPAAQAQQRSAAAQRTYYIYVYYNYRTPLGWTGWRYSHLEWGTWSYCIQRQQVWNNYGSREWVYGATFPQAR